VTNNPDHAPIVEHTREWLQKVVIGLNLCPFARAAATADLIRFVVSTAKTKDQLIADLTREMLALTEADPEQTETTLLIHPWVLTEFLDYNDFLDIADELLKELDLIGVLQVASFHPRYQFADSEPEAIENYSNRSPYPMLHLLREESVSRAAESHPGVDSIPDTNVATLRRLGHKGWSELNVAVPGSKVKE
jgi:uncharacterized protein